MGKARFHIKSKEVKNMKTLEQIRQQNKRNNMFFDGMEEKSVQLSPEAIEAGREFFEDCIKPTVRRVLNRQLSNGKI